MNEATFTGQTNDARENENQIQERRRIGMFSDAALCFSKTLFAG